MGFHLNYENRVKYIEELLNRIGFIKSSMSSIELLNYILKEINYYAIELENIKEAYEWCILRTSKGMYVGPLTKSYYKLYSIYKESQCSTKQQS